MHRLSAVAVRCAGLLRTSRRFALHDPKRPWKDYDDPSFTGRLDTHDPALRAQSIELSDVPEMAADDVRLMIQTMNANFSKSVYALTLFDLPDLLRLLSWHKLLPLNDRSVLRRWFFNPADALRNPGLIAEAMGPQRWGILSVELEKALDLYDAESSAIAIALRGYGLPNTAWSPILRWIASEGLESDFKQQLPSFAVAVAEARGPSALGINGMPPVQRKVTVGRLLMSAGKEFGRVGLASLGVDLMRSVKEPVTFRDQKTLMITVSRASRRALDWQLRQSGAIERSLDSWNLNGMLLTRPISTILPVAMPPAQDTLIEDSSQVDPTEEEDATVQTDAAIGVRPDIDLLDERMNDVAEEPGSVAGDIPDLPADLVHRTSEAVEKNFESADELGDQTQTDLPITSFFAPSQRKSPMIASLEKKLGELPVAVPPKKLTKEEKSDRAAQARSQKLQKLLHSKNMASSTADRKKPQHDDSEWITAIKSGRSRKPAAR